MVALNLIVMVGSLLASGNAAQYPATNSSPQYSVEFQDDQVRVRRVSLRAGEATPVEDHPDAVLIYLTADLDGRAPAAAATWQPMGTYGLQNHARTSFEALLVELIAPASGVPASAEPEAMSAYSYSSWSTGYPFHEPDAHRASTLVENARVGVTWHRLVPLVQTEPYHFHQRDTLLVYLRGGEMSGSTGQLGFHRARRGEFHVLPPHVLHALGNVGNDPVEFVMIAPK
jgi:quercetin dioxygenase-like cupin family protein